MIVGLGIDYVEVVRMGRLLERFPERAAGRLFTPEERSLCAGRAAPAECFAARFAAKEAFLKALGTGFRAGIPWQQIEIAVDAAGRPELRLSGRAREMMDAIGGRRSHLSLSHDAGAAIAAVIIEAGPDA